MRRWSSVHALFFIVGKVTEEEEEEASAAQDGPKVLLTCDGHILGQVPRSVPEQVLWC